MKWFSARQRGMALGIMTVGAYLGCMHAWNMLRTSKFWLIGTSYLAMAFATYVAYTFLVTYATKELKMEYTVASMLVTVSALCGIPGALILPALCMHARSYPEVDAALDRPYVVLGKKHRKLFHSPEESYTLGSLVASDPWGGLAGLLHVWLDQKCSADRKFKKFLEFMVKEDTLRRKQMRQMRKLLKKRR